MARQLRWLNIKVDNWRPIVTWPRYVFNAYYFKLLFMVIKLTYIILIHSRAFYIIALDVSSVNSFILMLLLTCFYQRYSILFYSISCMRFYDTYSPCIRLTRAKSVLTCVVQRTKTQRFCSFCVMGFKVPEGFSEMCTDWLQAISNDLKREWLTTNVIFSTPIPSVDTIRFDLWLPVCPHIPDSGCSEMNSG